MLRLDGERAFRCLWRCPECGREVEPGPAFISHDRPRWCLDGHEETPAPMTLVEQERVFPSPAVAILLESLEVSDWGLAAQAVKHYADNRRRAARKRPGVENVMRGVFARFDAMYRAFNALGRYAPGDTGEGGRIVSLDLERAGR